MARRDMKRTYRTLITPCRITKLSIQRENERILFGWECKEWLFSILLLWLAIFLALILIILIRVNFADFSRYHWRPSLHLHTPFHTFWRAYARIGNFEF